MLNSVEGADGGGLGSAIRIDRDGGGASHGQFGEQSVRYGLVRAVRDGDRVTVRDGEAVILLCRWRGSHR
jgi:hypothetical protein